MSTKDKKNDNEPNDSNEVNESKPRTRIREIDFMRVEDTLHGCALSPFELEVKDKIASAPSPIDILTQGEDREEKKSHAHYTLSRLLAYAHLSQVQKACYELLYHECLTDKEAASRMSLSRVRIRTLRFSITQSLLKARQIIDFKDAVQKRLARLEKTLMSVSERAELSPREKDFYESFFISGLSDEETILYANIREQWEQDLRRKIFKKIMRVFGNEFEDLILARRVLHRAWQILKLRYEEGLTYPEIASRLNVTESALLKSLKQVEGELDFEKNLPRQFHFPRTGPPLFAQYSEGSGCPPEDVSPKWL